MSCDTYPHASHTCDLTRVPSLTLVTHVNWHMCTFTFTSHTCELTHVYHLHMHNPPSMQESYAWLWEEEVILRSIRVFILNWSIIKSLNIILERFINFHYSQASSPFTHQGEFWEVENQGTNHLHHSRSVTKELPFSIAQRHRAHPHPSIISLPISIFIIYSLSLHVDLEIELC